MPTFNIGTIKFQYRELLALQKTIFLVTTKLKNKTYAEDLILRSYKLYCEKLTIILICNFFEGWDTGENKIKSGYKRKEASFSIPSFLSLKNDIKILKILERNNDLIKYFKDSRNHLSIVHSWTNPDFKDYYPPEKFNEISKNIGDIISLMSLNFDPDKDSAILDTVFEKQPSFNFFNESL